MVSRFLASATFAAAAFHAFAGTYCFAVKTVGHGKPIILIPGLTCSGTVWNDTVDRLKSKFTCYVLTLPGFGGQPPIAGPFLPRVRDDIIAFVKDHRLDHPAVIGHSLGGFMTFDLGVKEPQLFGPLIAVDGLPFIGALSNPAATAESSKALGDQIYATMKNVSRDAFKQQVRRALDTEITDPKNAAKFYTECEASDPGDTAEAMKEMFTTDLRQDVAKIDSPVLLIGAGQWLPNDQPALKKGYESQIAKCKHAEFLLDGKSRHFIMIDDPEFFYNAIEAFLAKHGYS